MKKSEFVVCLAAVLELRDAIDEFEQYFKAVVQDGELSLVKVKELSAGINQPANVIGAGILELDLSLLFVLPPVGERT